MCGQSGGEFSGRSDIVMPPQGTGLAMHSHDSPRFMLSSWLSGEAKLSMLHIHPDKDEAQITRSVGCSMLLGMVTLLEASTTALHAEVVVVLHLHGEARSMEIPRPLQLPA